MKFSIALLGLLCVASSLSAEEYRSELFPSLKLVYQDDFNTGKLDTNHWQIRQGSTWMVKDGILVGGPSPKEYQDKKVAEGDKAHAGFKPVIWLEKVPENLVVHFRVRFDAENYAAKFPLIDVGHHVNSLNFTENMTTLTLKKDVKSLQTKEVSLPLNQWVDVTIELKKGILLLKLDGKKFVFQDALIDMVDQHQIDFKGVDHGGIQIDDVKVYEGTF
ncbi:MAG: hypothetical protein NTW52_18920 [Planctomycetota bacterium]|nr:hypothetical protein [Planctomycetota bacterium]